ncbi:MAG TPA: hypothetical protein VK890_01000, partial [Bacteroidia bacterium]|nr:hypothetical protein [Bacteroidia bacterium]
MPVINELNRGVWGWFISDTVLVAAIDGNALYEFTDNTFSSLILLGGVTSGTVLPGLQNQIAVYPAVGNKVEGSSALPALVQVSTGSLNSGINAVSNTFWAGDGTWKTVASATSHSKYAVYVSGDGNDSTGNGSINAPYKTVVKAMSTITTNTITTPFNICLLGGTITETLSLAFKPFVSIVGLSESVIWHLASTSLDASWGTTTGATMTLSNFTWNSNPIFMDFSAFTNVDSPIIYINNVFGSSGLVCKGSANNNPNFFISDCVLISMNYSNCFVQLDSSQVVTLKANSAKLDANLAPNTLYSVGCTLGTTIIAGQNSGPSTTATFYGTRFSTGGLTGDGLTVLLLQDASSYVSPILLNSATSNIVSISNGLLANYTPVNYTPVATPPTSTSSVQAHLHGIDNALTSITSSNNYIYVSNTGNDVSGNGSIEKPYATVAHAETVITTATSNNPFTIVMIGGTIIESGSVTLKPFINVTASSENVIWQLSGLMALDASWSTTSAGMVVFSNFSFNTFDIVLDFSSETNVATHTIIFSNINSLGRSISVYGSTNTVPTSYCSNCLLFSYVVENSIAYLNSNILSGSFLMGQFNPIVATATAYLLANRIGANVTITGATSGGILSTIHFYSSRIAGSLTINNVNAAVNIDAVSYKVPTVSGGGVINLTSISNGLSANYSPVNYTPVAVAPDLPTSVHAHLAGIDAKLGIISPATNPFNTVYVNSNGGVDAVGNGSILKPYLTIEFALSQITTASSSNIYFMQCYGIFTPVTLNLKPWVFINGNNSSLTSSNPIGKDVAWSTTAGTVYFSNFQLNANITMDLSANTAPTIIYLEKLINPLTTPTFTFTGVTQLNIVGCENSVGSKIALSITNCSCNIQNCSLGAVSFTYSIHISPVYYLYLIGNSFLSGSSSSLSLTTSSTAGVFAAASGNIFQGTALTITAPTGAPTFSCNNATGFNSITLSGANSTFIPDMLSVTPTFSGGASATNISYASLAASITAGFTPVNYTPATPQVKSHLQAI